MARSGSQLCGQRFVVVLVLLKVVVRRRVSIRRIAAEIPDQGRRALWVRQKAIGERRLERRLGTPIFFRNLAAHFTRPRRERSGIG